LDPAIIAIVVALIGPFATYLVAVRQLSGKIKNSDAEQLWEESRSIREWSTNRNKELVEQIELLKLRLDELEQSNRALVAENEHLRQTVARLKTEAQHQWGPHVDLSPDPPKTGDENAGES
jgi:regulator of replication initiation timing